MMNLNGTLKTVMNLTLSYLETTRKCRRNSKKNSKAVPMALVARKLAVVLLPEVMAPIYSQVIFANTRRLASEN